MHWIALALLLSVAAPTAAPPNLPELDALWLRRDEPAAFQTFQARLDTELSAHPEDFELLWRAARLHEWVADGERDKELKMQLAKKAWALGDRATARNPNAVQGYYYAALGIGVYSDAAGVLRALGEGLESKFNERIDTANRLDSNWSLSGGLVAKGRYWAVLPWPKRNLGKAAELIQRAIAQHPDNLTAWVYLADVQLKDGQPAKAKQTLDRALHGEMPVDPPAARRAKEKAEKVRAALPKEGR